MGIPSMLGMRVAGATRLRFCGTAAFRVEGPTMESSLKSEAPMTKRSWRWVVGYLLMLVVAIGLFFVIRAMGEGSAATLVEVATDTDTPQVHAATLPHLLGALVAIIITGRLLGAAMQRLGQPRVIGEVVAGILLGPSLLGRVSPGAMAWLLPDAIMPSLEVIAQLGVVLFMFLVGLELNAEFLRDRVHKTIVISHAGIVTPFLMGTGLALWLFPQLAPAGVPFTSFALFLGVSLSITAFPVLARILTEHRLEQTELGVLALSCAAAGDATAWCLLAFVVGVAQSAVAGAIATALLTVLFIGVMFGVVRPLLRGWLAESDPSRINGSLVTWVLVALLLSALAAEAIGIHALFGAFLLGAMIPHDSAVARAFHDKLHDMVVILLLPAFFAHTGMRTEIGLVNGLSEWLTCGAIIVVATLGKLGGTMISARLTGIDWRTSASLGVLMNTRGLMELIVLNIGLDLGVISPTLFAMMVLMALATTIATTPVLGWLRGTSPRH